MKPENTDTPLKADCPSAPCSAWVDAASKPRVGRKVIVCGIRKSGTRWMAMARWQPAETIDATYWEEYPDGWEHEDGDRITNPMDIWLEESEELETTGFLEDVTHWMPLPELPPHPYTVPTEILPQNAEVARTEGAKDL